MHFVFRWINLRADDLVHKLQFDRPQELLLLLRQPTRDAFPYAGLNHESLTFLDIDVEFNLLLKTGRLTSPHGADVLQKTVVLRRLQKTQDRLAGPQQCLLFLRHFHEDIRRKHGPQHRPGILVGLSVAHVGVDFPDLPQREIADNSVLETVFLYAEFVQRHRIDGQNLLSDGRFKQPFVKFHCNVLRLHGVLGTLTRPLELRAFGGKN